jgi:TetR/AcrR family transcriptional repressor of nem operon
MKNQIVVNSSKFNLIQIITPKLAFIDDWSYICFCYNKIYKLTSTKFEEKKSCIISSGMDLMWDLGYNGTSVNDIVKAAGVPKGSFYFYFDSKEDFAVQTLREYFKESYGGMRKILFQDEESPLQRIKQFYATRIEELSKQIDDNRGCLACNLSSEVADHIPGIQAEVARIHKQVLGDLITVGKQAQEAGEFSEDLDVEKMFAFIEDAGKGTMVSIKALGNHSPIESFKYMLDRMLQ